MSTGVRSVGFNAEETTYAERLRLRLISASQEDGVWPTQFFELLDAFISEEVWEDLGISFKDLIKEPLPTGLGLAEDEFRKLLTVHHRYENQDTKVRERMNRVRRRAKDLLDEPLADRGRPKRGEEHKTLSDNVKQGTSESYLFRRLKRDHPDLAEKVVAGELKAKTAAKKAGFVKKTVEVPLEVEGAAKKLRKHFDPDELYEAMRSLG